MNRQVAIIFAAVIRLSLNTSHQTFDVQHSYCVGFNKLQLMINVAQNVWQNNFRRTQKKVLTAAAGVLYYITSSFFPQF